MSDPATRPGCEIRKCWVCGTTTLTFDPPVIVEVAETCGAVKPGTYTAHQPGGIPVCEETKGHDGDHTYLVEYEDRWSNDGSG